MEKAINQKAYESLRKQRPRLLEDLHTLLEDYFPDRANENQAAVFKEKMESRRIMELYLSRLDDFLSSVEGSEEVDDDLLPFAVIGSKVRLQDEEGEELEFIIVYPGASDPSVGRISFFSPLGRNLLLKIPGEKIQVEAPAGTFQYTVLDVRWAGEY